MCTTMTRKQWVLIALLAVVILGQKPVYAMPMSCFAEYQAFTTQSWNTYNQCILDTNDDPWGAKLLIRQGCRLEWISNALQAEGAYVSCMANFSALWR